MKRFFHQPRSVLLRRALFQVHLWVGVFAGVYILVVCLTGAALVFRIDLQRMANPELFTPLAAGPAADAATALERLSDAFPEGRISGLDAPTATRPTYLAYVVLEDRFLTVLADPVTLEVLGELPERSFVRTLQDLHFDLLGGPTGRMVNGVGAFLLLLLCVTGLVIWWPGSAEWRRGFTIDPSRNWKRINWETHRAVGIWTVAMLMMWALTGMYFGFPTQFRAAIDRVSPITVIAAPEVDPATAGPVLPTARELIQAARERMPGRHVARVVLPFHERAPFLVQFAGVAPTPGGHVTLASVYLDPYTGDVLSIPSAGPRSAGDLIVTWIRPLHVGNFAGYGVKILWFVLALAPPLLFVTGFIAWWNRVVRPRWHRS